MNHESKPPSGCNLKACALSAHGWWSVGGWTARRVRILIWVFLAGLILIGDIGGRAWAYEAEGHYALTYYLALQLGFTRRQAFQIASAAYAIDLDAHTSPMSATPGDIIFGAGWGWVPRTMLPWNFGVPNTILPYNVGLIPSKNLESQRIWRDFHAFASAHLMAPTLTAAQQKELLGNNPLGEMTTQINRVAGCLLTGNKEAIALGLLVGEVERFPDLECRPEVKAAVNEQRKQRKQKLWAQALLDHNPGTLIHYAQDSYAHYFFGDEEGHALAGHAPDFLSFDPGRSAAATQETLEWLKKFRDTLGTFGTSTGDYLVQKPLDPDPQKVANVLAQLIEVNPKPSFSDAELYDPEGPERTVPNLGKSIAIINSAVGHDDWPYELGKYASPQYDEKIADLPPSWWSYSFDSDGHPLGPEAAVERLALRFDKPSLRVVKLNIPPQIQSSLESQNEEPALERVKVSLSMKYNVPGLTQWPENPILREWDFPEPLPVIETHRISGRATEPLIIKYQKGSATGLETQSFDAGGGLYGQARWSGEWHTDVSTRLYGADSRRPYTGSPHTIPVIVELSKKDYEAGTLTWTPSVRLYGYDAKTGPEVTLAPPDKCLPDASAPVLETLSPAFGAGSTSKLITDVKKCYTIEFRGTRKQVWKNCEGFAVALHFTNTPITCGSSRTTIVDSFCRSENGSEFKVVGQMEGPGLWQNNGPGRNMSSWNGPLGVCKSDHVYAFGVRGWGGPLSWGFSPIWPQQPIGLLPLDKYAGMMTAIVWLEDSGSFTATIRENPR